MMKLLQEIRGFADLSNRRPQSRAPGLFLMQLRSHLLRATLPRRAQNIRITDPGIPEVPYPVKITHRRIRT
jgi:hypothetical protein